VSCPFNIAYLSFILCKRTEDCIQFRHSQGKQSQVRVQYRNSLNLDISTVVVIVILILLLHCMIRRIRKCLVLEKLHKTKQYVGIYDGAVR